MVRLHVISNDLGIPAKPRIEMVESEWVDGRTLAKH
jgi:hypothetical protein